MLAKKINISPFSFIFFLLFLPGINISCGGQQGTEIQSKTSLPPVITSITILPDSPRKESELSLFIRSHNPGWEPLTYRYQWIKNDNEISGENKDTLKSGNFKKRDFVQVRVIASNGKVDGQSFLSDPVKISNTPPVVEEVHIEPKLPYANSDLKAIVRSTDSDGDSVTYLYQWEKSGNVLSEGESEILESTRFKRGDSIAVTVTPNDGEKLGKPKKSEAIIIANSPPIIVSSPPAKLNGGNIYTYQVKTEDMDNDPITFGLRTAPKGMVINKEIGLIQWEVSRADSGDHLIEIEATDPEGAKSLQGYTLTIQFR